jgi:plastocyanin
MKGFRKRILGPLAIPLTATAIVVAVVFNLSRVLLVLEERNSAAVATVLAIIVAVAVLLGGAYFASRREARTAGLTVLATAGIVLVFAGGYGLGATGGGEGGGGEGELAAAAGEGEAAGGGGEVNILAKDPFTFEPKELSVPAGKIKVNLTNQGAIVHTLLFEQVPTFSKLVTSGTRRQAPGGEGPTSTGTVDLEPGTYVFFCDERGHRGAGMEGKLTVTKGGAGSAGGGGGAGAGGEASVVAKDPFLFEPKELTVPAGDVKVNLTNQGAIVHTLAFENVSGFEKLVASGTKRQAPGKGPTASGTVKLKPGTYVFFCDERGHRGAGMEGKLIVTEGGGGGGGGVAAAGGGEAGGGGGEANVVAKDPFAYEPKELTVAAGTIEVNLANEGAIVHTLIFEDVAGFEKLVASGTKRQAPGKGPTDSGTVKLKPGTYVFYCDERGHRGAGMEGKLIVS